MPPGRFELSETGVRFGSYADETVFYVAVKPKKASQT